MEMHRNSHPRVKPEGCEAASANSAPGRFMRVFEGFYAFDEGPRCLLYRALSKFFTGERDRKSYARFDFWVH
jgi:hypothetical protein